MSLLTPLARHAGRVRRLRRSGDDEAGSVLVIWVIALVGVMGMAAMAVDLGNIAQTKQHAETAVQDAVLSAVTTLAGDYANSGSVTTAQAEADAVQSAQAYLTNNFSSATNYDGCNSELPSGVTVWVDPSTLSSEDCIGFFPAGSSKPTGMAVALPIQQVAYTVGRAAGLHQQPVSAVAYASIKTADNGYGIPVTYAAGGGAGLECLKTSSGSTTCTGFTTGSGNFGLIDSPRYRTYASTGNGGGGNNPNIETDLAIGVDHALLIDTASSTPYCDAFPNVSGCTYYNNTPPTFDLANLINPETGQTQTDPTAALFTGGVATPSGNCSLGPRLNHPDGFVASGTCSSDDPATPPGATPSGPDLQWSGDTFGSSYPLNGVSIAKYLSSTSPNGEAVTSSCGTSAYLPAGTSSLADAADSVPIDGANGTAWSNFNGCLSGYITQSWPMASSVATSSDWIFSADIVKSPRFGIVPLIANTTGTGAQPILGFAAAYLDMGYAKTKGGKSLGAIGAWIFPLGLIQPKALPGFGQGDYHGGPYVVSLCSLVAGNC